MVVVDVRGFYCALGRDPVTAADSRSSLPNEMPNRGFGAVIGVHFYPFRGRSIALGIGGEMIFAGVGRTESETDELPPTIVNQRLFGLSGQVSLNFGHRDGWSYVSAGRGPLVSLRMSVTRHRPKAAETDDDQPRRRRTLVRMATRRLLLRHPFLPDPT